MKLRVADPKSNMVWPCIGVLLDLIQNATETPPLLNCIAGIFTYCAVELENNREPLDKTVADDVIDTFELVVFATPVPVE
jgi:hypothetical protein